jgi:hypothetical protein
LLGQVAQQTGIDQGANAGLRDALAVQGMINQNQQFQQQLRHRAWETQYRAGTSIYQQRRGIEANLASQRYATQARFAQQAMQNQASAALQQQQMENRNQLAVFDRMSRMQMQQEEWDARNQMAQASIDSREQMQRDRIGQEKELFEWKFTEGARQADQQRLAGYDRIDQAVRDNRLNLEEADAMKNALDAQLSGLREVPHIGTQEDPLPLPKVEIINGEKVLVNPTTGDSQYIGPASEIPEEVRDLVGKPRLQADGSIITYNTRGEPKEITPPINFDIGKIGDKVEKAVQAEQEAFLNQVEGQVATRAPKSRQEIWEEIFNQHLYMRDYQMNERANMLLPADQRQPFPYFEEWLRNRNAEMRQRAGLPPDTGGYLTQQYQTARMRFDEEGNPVGWVDPFGNPIGVEQPPQTDYTPPAALDPGQPPKYPYMLPSMSGYNQATSTSPPPAPTEPTVPQGETLRQEEQGLADTRRAILEDLGIDPDEVEALSRAGAAAARIR